MSKVKILKTSLVIVLIALITFGVGITLALNSNEVKIEISEVPNIDVVLSKAKTNVNLSTFEKDLKDKLEEEGVDLSKVTLKTVETESVSSTSSDANTIFNTWKRIGVTAPWYFNGTNIIDPENHNGYSGFMCPDTKYSKITMSYNNYSSDSDDDSMGSIIRANINEDGTFTGYAFVIDRGGYERGLYKIVNKEFGPTRLGSICVDKVDISNRWNYSWINYRLEADGNNIKVYMNDKLIID